MQYSDFLTRTVTQPKTITGTLKYSGVEVLTYSISYPDVWVNLKASSHQISSCYVGFSNQIKKNIMSTYYRRACTYYKNIVSADYVPMKVMCEMSVMYENRGFLSLFFDTYEQVGALNLRSVRRSNTWHVSAGTLLPLSHFFMPNSGYKKIIYDNICRQIKSELTQNAHSYFSDWSDILAPRLDLSCFYLADDGIVVYFGEYRIAPKTQGMPSFLIPYTAFGSKLKYDL